MANPVHLFYTSKWLKDLPFEWFFVNMIFKERLRYWTVQYKIYALKIYYLQVEEWVHP